MYFLWLKTTGTWSVEIKVNAVVFLTIVEYGTPSKGSSPQTYFMTLPDSKLKAVYKKGDKFCDAKKVKGKKTFTPIESQPENVIELVRNYSVLKKDATYRRRVSWLGIGARESIALVEYFGKFPGLSQHGNGKEGTEYIRTPASVMTEMSDMLKRENPLKVYNKHDELSGPSSRKQVHDKKYNDKKKERKDAGVALAPKILEPKKSPILIFCRQFSNIEAKLWFHFLSSRFLSHFCKYTS